MSTLFMNAHFISATHCAMHIPKNILLSIDFIFNNTGIHFLISNRNSFIGTGNTTATIQRLFKTHHIMQITAYIHVHIQHTVMDLKKIDHRYIVICTKTSKWHQLLVGSCK